MIAFKFQIHISEFLFSNRHRPLFGYVPKCGRPGEQPNAYPQSLDISSAAKSLMNKLFIDTIHRLDYQQIRIQALLDKIDLDNIRNDRLEEKCNRLEASDSSLRVIVDQQNLSLEHKKEMIEKLELESQTYQRELKRLSKQVEVLVEERAATESKTEHLLGEINDMQTEAKQKVENLHQPQLEELQGVIVQLEEEKMVSIRKLAGRDKQITSYREQLETSQKQAANLQLILDEERRKSRDDQKRNLVLLETREVQVEDKNAEISDLNKRILELEDKIEQQEREKANFERKEEDLKEIIEELGDKIEQQEREKANFERKEEDLKEIIEELGDKIEQQEREKANFERKEEDLKEIIEELGDKIEQQEREKANFERKEEDLKEIIEELGDKIEQQEREKANFERKEEDLKEIIEELGDKIEQQEREKANFERKEEDLKEFIEELGDKIEQQEREKANFERKEEDLKEIIEELGDKIEQQEREKANFERKEEDLKEIIEELGDKIEQQEREKANFERKEEDLKEFIEELGDKIEQQEREKANFERKEEDLKEFIEELGDKIEQQEREKANFERKEEDLKEIIEELGDKIEQQEREKANFERKEEDLKEIIEELGDKIEQQEREKANFERKEEDLKEIIEELGDKIEQQEREKANFERKEEDLKEIIEKLKNELMTKTEKAKLTAEMKESIANQVHVYQEEVQQQKQIIYSVNVKEFLSFPSPTKLHSIGGNLTTLVRQELGDDIKDIDKTVATLIRISTVVTKEDKKSCETVCQCADNILEEAFKADSNVGSLFANAYLVYIGLLKGEDKKYRPPSDITGPLIVLKHIVKQTYFPHRAKKIISAFMNKPQPLLDKSFASEWRESGKKKKKQKPKPTPAPTENHNDTKPDRRDNRDRNERDNRDRNKEQKENGERNFCEQSDNYRQRARRNDNRLPRLSGGRGRPDRAGDRPERGEEENEKDVYRDRGFDCGRGRGRGFGPRRGRGGGSGRGVGGTFRPNRGFENKNSQIDNGPQIDTWTNETAVIGEKEPKISNWGDSKEDWNEDIDSWTESLAETKVITASGSSASEPTNQVPIESNALSNTFDLGGLYPKHLQNDMSAEARYISQFNQQATESIKNCIGIGSGQSSSLQNSMTSQTASNGNSLTGTSVTGSGLSVMTGSSLSAGSQSVAGPSNAIPASSVSQNAMLQQRQKPQRSKLPPPSKIPASAVEMPGYMMTTLDVQFGNLEFGSDSSAFSFRGNESVNSAFTSADSNSTSTVNDHGGATVGQVQNLSKTSESLISGGLEQSSPWSSSLCQQSPYTTRTKQNQRLSKQVEVLVEERAATESKTEHLLVEINNMQTEAKQKVENLHQPQLEELQKGDQSPSEAEMELPAGWVWQDDWQKDLGRAVDEEGTPSPYWDEAFDFIYRTPVTPYKLYPDEVFCESPGAAATPLQLTCPPFKFKKKYYCTCCDSPGSSGSLSRSKRLSSSSSNITPTKPRTPSTSTGTPRNMSPRQPFGRSTIPTPSTAFGRSTTPTPPRSSLSTPRLSSTPKATPTRSGRQTPTGRTTPTPSGRTTPTMANGPRRLPTTPKTPKV